MNTKAQKFAADFDLEAFEVSVCKSKEMQSFLNVFHFKEENQSKEHLGELFGVIKVFDYSQQSAYLPNLLSQILKKEFFSNQRKTAEEAFESSLKKANVALSDLTRHEVVSWIGKLHAVLGVIQKNNFYFTQSGGGRILLLRDKKIIDISRDLDAKDSDHPMKTFSDISSGKLLVNDKVIFSTESLFETFSWEDLKRHSNAFESSEFDNLLKSTLELEANDVGISVVNIKERVLPQVVSLPRTKNKFGGNYFGDQRTSEQKKEKVPSKLQSDFDLPAKETDSSVDVMHEDGKGLSPFEKQPELYIKENEEIVIENKKPDSLLGMLRDAIDKTKSQQKNKVAEKDSGGNYQVENSSIEETEKTKKNKKRALTENAKASKESSFKIEDMMAFSGLPITKTEINIEKPKKLLDKPKQSEIHNDTNEINDMPIKIAGSLSKRTNEIELSSELAKRKSQTQNSNDIKSFFGENDNANVGSDNDRNNSKTFDSNKAPTNKTSAGVVKKIIPKKEHLEIAKGLVISHLNQFSLEYKKLKQKRQQSNLEFSDFLKSPYIFSTMIFVIILILILFLFFKQNDQKNIELSSNQAPNANLNPEEQQLYITDKEVKVRNIGNAESEIISIASYKNDVYLITASNRFYRYDNNLNNFAGLPSSDQIHDVVSLVEMPVLNLIFFISNESIYSYSPVLERFDEHKIEYPDNLDLIGAGVHRSFSFLYVFDRNSGQVYRYPRTEGGFGSPISWFQQPISAEKIVTFAIDDGIRVAYADGTIEQYYQKKLKDTFIINTEQKVIPRKIFTNNELDFYYILDAENPRILKISKNDNKISDQYWNKQFDGAIDLVVHEEKEIYVASKNNELLQFSLQ